MRAASIGSGAAASSFASSPNSSGPAVRLSPRAHSTPPSRKRTSSPVGLRAIHPATGQRLPNEPAGHAERTLDHVSALRMRQFGHLVNQGQLGRAQNGLHSSHTLITPTFTSHYTPICSYPCGCSEAASLRSSAPGRLEHQICGRIHRLCRQGGAIRSADTATDSNGVSDPSGHARGHFQRAHRGRSRHGFLL